jgi:two-component system sensor histidine kinase VicK
VLAAGEPVVAWADASALGRVFGNLLSNAVKYSPHGGTITVEVTGQDGEAVVCVRDEGIGIPPEHLGRVFDRFYRVPNDLATRQGGIGLGLPVCKALVEAHGGRIWVDSRPGQGSTFAFTVPLADEAHLAKVHAHADAPPSPG